MQLQPAQAVARVGTALCVYRLRRELSPSDLARLAGVSPSAISQVERGERGLSLDTLLALAGRLNITLDELLGGEVTPDYRIGRRHGLGDLASGSVIPLLDDAEAGMRAYLVSMPRSATVDAPFTHKGTELVGVVSRLVQVLLASGRPVLRRGADAARLSPRDRRLAQRRRKRRAVPVGAQGLSTRRRQPGHPPPDHENS